MFEEAHVQALRLEREPMQIIEHDSRAYPMIDTANALRKSAVEMLEDTDRDQSGIDRVELP